MMRPMAAGLLLCLCGCSKMRNIDGEVFLHGPDRQTVNVPGVEVAAHDVDVCAAVFREMSDELSNRGNRANRLYDETSKLADLLASRAKKAADAARNATGAEQEKKSDLHREAAELERRGIELRNDSELLARWESSAAPCFEKLPPALGPPVKTDAQGRFSIPVPKNKHVVLVAVVESSATGELETHHWIVKVADWEKTATLSSANTTGARQTGSSGKGDTLLQTSPLPASVAGVNMADLPASIERRLEELSNVVASSPAN